MVRFLATPTVAKHRLFVWLPADAIPDQQRIAFAREDDYFFGVLHSRAHEVWSLRMGTWLGVGNDPRYTPTTCFDTFPLPWPPGQEPEDDPRHAAIADAVRMLNDLRERWLNPPDASEAELKKRTLTNLYNARPAWLAHAHAALDRAVWAAYGWDDGDPGRRRKTRSWNGSWRSTARGRGERPAPAGRTLRRGGIIPWAGALGAGHGARRHGAASVLQHQL